MLWKSHHMKVDPGKKALDHNRNVKSCFKGRYLFSRKLVQFLRNKEQKLPSVNPFHRDHEVGKSITLR